MVELAEGKIVKVAGPVGVAEGMIGARMYDVVRVGEDNLIGEIVELSGDQASIQVYEDTVGVGPGGVGAGGMNSPRTRKSATAQAPHHGPVRHWPDHPRTLSAIWR